ncbi:hypothetical protein D3C75_829150 [compost metagenome]
MLVTKNIVHAPLMNAHTGNQILHGGFLIALLPKNIHRLAQHVVYIKLFVSCHNQAPFCLYFIIYRTLGKY